MRTINLLFVGSFYAHDFSSNTHSSNELLDSKISGTVLSLQNTYKLFLKYFSKKSNFIIQKFDTNNFRLKKNKKNLFGLMQYLFNFIYYYILLILKIVASKRILVNSSPHGLAYLGPLIFLSRVLFKRCVIRIFGGRDPLDVHFFLKPLVLLSLWSSSSVGIQSKRITNKFNTIFSSHKFFWLPTARPKPHFSYIKKRKQIANNFKGNFYYLGHIREDKGIDFLINAFMDKRLSRFRLDLYGPLWGQLGKNSIYEMDLKNSHNIFYHGSLPPNKVYKVISEHDALIFPTISPAEGYPGAVIESLLVGTPILASNWLHLNEFLNDSNSILFKPYNSDSIVNSVLEFANNKEKRINLHIGALNSSKNMFSLNRQTQLLMTHLKI